MPKKREKEADADNQRTDVNDKSGATNSENESSADDLRPYDEKIGERDDNLRRRSDWFQKRSGGR